MLPFKKKVMNYKLNWDWIFVKILQRKNIEKYYAYFSFTPSTEAESSVYLFIIFTKPLRSGRIWHKVNF